MGRLRISDIDAMKEGESRKISYKRDGVEMEGFVIRFRGRLHAWENRCRHLPLPLDYGDGRFFSPDGMHLVCATHGAVYEPDTGLCIQGPCAGLGLKPLQAEWVDGDLVVET
ncbi:MAG: Rieske 2Fe-2S domain-containing protein [Phycisphaeraceae bacterium]|nr:Rieske 2Fe-2S domain-containing protein [Phycisphaeraceae bacterium]